MSGAAWWKDGVIYQLYPRSFADSNGDGVGDLPGITSRLDYLADLGVDGIWLSPIYPSPMKDFGYDISDYRTIDPVFGTQADFDTLIAEAHKRGLRVVMDMVMNHTSDAHPWFVESRASRNNPKRDWYHWHDGRNGKPPSNWLAVFGGSAWQWDEATRQYYLHLFDPSQPDLNWENPAVTEAFLDIWRFWLDRGVDGFRLDVAHMLTKHPHYPDAAPALGVTPYTRQRHDHYTNLPGTHAIWRRFRGLLDQYPGSFAVAEPDLRGVGAEGYYGTGDDELHLTFNFGFFWKRYDAAQLQRVITGWLARLPPGAHPCWVLSNHDFGRHVQRWSAGRHTDARAKVAAALLLTLPGTPFLYYGEELAMRQARVPRRELQDPPGKRYWPFYRGRDGMRTPMQWGPGPRAGFTTGRPWMRLAPEADRLNVERESADPASVLHCYKQLLALRRRYPALRRGELRPWFERPKKILAYSCTLESQELSVCLNLSRFTQKLALRGVFEVLLSTHREAGTVLRGTVGLQADEALVLAPS